MTDAVTPPGQLTYADAGVDIAAGNSLVERIKPLVAATARPESMSSIGGFGALFSIPQGYQHPVLVSGTDGVGTKLKVAMDYGVLRGLGIDLVAMCVNDILTCGAEPLFFLDYYATGKLDLDAATAVIAGIADGCRQAGATLAGGETAEMPGLYRANDFDLAGFCVGIVEKDRIVDGREIAPGDCLLGLASSGLHSNGYSLVRRIIEEGGYPLDSDFQGMELGALLIEPTRIYVPAIRALLQAVPVKGLAHITGGGLIENIPRILPEGTAARVTASSWRRPPIFEWLRRVGRVADADWHRTFNDGIGFIAVVPREASDTAMQTLTAAGETVWPIGQIIASDTRAVIIR